MDEAALALALVPDVGPVRYRALIEKFGSADGALQAPFEFLCTVAGITEPVARAIIAADRAAAAAVLTRVVQLRGQLVAFGAPEYPELLQSLEEPPACLFLQGNAELLRRPAVAIVGSRNHSHYGAEVCRALARSAAAAGLVVISGMARGLDALAHRGALDAGGGTIGVLGSGLGVQYPRCNRRLYDEVLDQHGLLVTEYPPDLPPHEGSFPRRNRIISGLARVTVVVEAVKASGALQTVAWAQKQGREVMAIPGPITSPVSAGTNGLIRDGAAPLLDLDDLLFHYPEVRRRSGSEPPPSPELSPVETCILNRLWSGPRRLEELVEAAGAPVPDALDALSSLELGGRIRQRKGGWYEIATTRLFE